MGVFLAVYTTDSTLQRYIPQGDIPHARTHIPHWSIPHPSKVYPPRGYTAHTTLEYTTPFKGISPKGIYRTYHTPHKACSTLQRRRRRRYTPLGGIPKRYHLRTIKGIPLTIEIRYHMYSRKPQPCGWGLLFEDCYLKIAI